MRCYACNCPLSPSESTRRFKASECFTELCNKCLSTITEDGALETVDGEGSDEDLFDEDGNPRED